MRQRVEDLGRIAVLTDVLLNLDLWDKYQGRNKDFLDHFRTLSEGTQDDLLHDLIYGIDHLKDKLYEINSIAEGMDVLNERCIGEL
jgi:hypothetical protein